MELSVIVPTFNEEQALPALMASLAIQQEVRFELIVSDGGSTDATIATAHHLADSNGIDARVVTGERGRGVQLNSGAETARGRFLLFLHADSIFEDRSALRKGIDAVAASDGEGKNLISAGRYSLSLRRSSPGRSLPYYYYECKARLNRRGCTHGDQGIMVSQEVFRKNGPFQAFPTMLAETRFADLIRWNGTLLLIPAVISTSARRFEAEGLYQRQVMNAILMNCAAISWEEPFRLLPEIYHQHDRCGRLMLSPLLEEIHRLIAAMTPRQRSRFWRSTGSYVRANAWQIPFFLDARKNFSKGLPAGRGDTPILDRFDRWWDRVTDNPAGVLAAALVTRLWFSLTRGHARFSEKL